MSGVLCAHRISAVQMRAVLESSAIDSFIDWTNGQFDHDTEALRTLYQRHPEPGIAALFRAPAPPPAF